RAGSPCVEAARAHFVQPTHHSDRERFTVGFDELEDLGFRSEVNAMAFFKISCSSFSRSYFFFISRSDFSSAATSSSIRISLFTICPSRICLRQRDNMNGWMERDSATSCTATPGTSLSRTAVALNRSLYLFVVLGPGLGISHS